MDWNRLLHIAEAEVERTIRSLPPALRGKAERLPITYAPRPNPALEEDGIEPDTLGLFVGGALADSAEGAVSMPPQILLFLENLWEAANGCPTGYRLEIRTTLLHELGHYLGLDESDLEARGLE